MAVILYLELHVQRKVIRCEKLILSFKMLQTGPDEIGNMFNNFTDSVSSILSTCSLPQSTFSCFLLVDRLLLVFKRGHTTSELGKPLQDSADATISTPSSRNLF
jgi:hypothetical protein